MKGGHIDWTEVPPGPSRLAMHVIAQAKADLDHPHTRKDALAFLRGEGDEEGEATLPFWCEVAGIDPLTVVSYVRHERETLEETARHKVGLHPKGSEVGLTNGEVRALVREGAIFLGNGRWQWNGWVVSKEGRGGTSTASAASEDDAWGEDCSQVGGGIDGVREAREEEREEGEEA